MIKIRGVCLQSINYILTTLLSKLLRQVWNKLPIVTMQVDDGNRLAYRLFVRSCYELLVSQLVNNLLRENDISFVGSTCCESVGLINLVKKEDQDYLFQRLAKTGTTGNKRCEHILLTSCEVFLSRLVISLNFHIVPKPLLLKLPYTSFKSPYCFTYGIPEQRKRPINNNLNAS